MRLIWNVSWKLVLGELVSWELVFEVVGELVSCEQISCELALGEMTMGFAKVTYVHVDVLRGEGADMKGEMEVRLGWVELMMPISVGKVEL